MPAAAGPLDHGTHLRAEDPFLLRLGEQPGQLRDRLHQLDAIGFLREPLSILRKGTIRLTFQR